MSVIITRARLCTLLLGAAELACTVDDRAVSIDTTPGDGSDGADTTDGGSAGSSTAQRTTTNTMGGTPTPPPGVTQMGGTATFEREFAGLVAQAAPWADLEVEVTGARLYRGSRPTGLAARVAFSELNVYAVLDINITQIGNGLTDYNDRNTWDLILADGTRSMPVNPLGVAISTGDSPTVRSYYRADEDTDFAGAALEVNGSEREAFEPLRIPLDAEQVFESQTVLTSLVGQVIAPVEGVLGYEVLEAYHGVNLLTVGRRAPRDQRLVLLNTRVRFSGLFSESFSSGRDGPKVSVNGNTLSPLEGNIDTIPTGGSIDFVTVYAIDEAAVSFDVVFDTRDEAFTRVPVVLPTAP